MASERQIAANRRNAAKSTGPRSKDGKRRARENSFRHGLASRAIFTAAATEQVAELARAIAEDHDSAVVHEWANTAAEAMLDLARVRQLRGALVNEIAAGQPTSVREQQLSESIPLKKSQSNVLDVFLSLQTVAESSLQATDRYKRIQALDRYERRFSGRRDRAIQNIVRYTRGEE